LNGTSVSELKNVKLPIDLPHFPSQSITFLVGIDKPEYDQIQKAHKKILEHCRCLVSKWWYHVSSDHLAFEPS